jgi:hypothetical protein
MAQWRLLTTSTTKRCENMWNFVKGIPKRLARKVLAQWGQEARAGPIFCCSTSVGYDIQFELPVQIVHPFFVRLIDPRPPYDAGKIWLRQCGRPHVASVCRGRSVGRLSLISRAT